MHNRMSETQGLPQRVAAERIEYSTKRVKDLHIRIREQFKANRSTVNVIQTNWQYRICWLTVCKTVNRCIVTRCANSAASKSSNDILQPQKHSSTNKIGKIWVSKYQDNCCIN